MQSRMKNPALVIPGALQALQTLNKCTDVERLPGVTRTLAHLRASQINGCSFCVDMHARELKDAGETDERIFSVAAWRETPYYSDAERAALALTEALTRLSDRSDPVPDDVWDEVVRYYDERSLAALILSIAIINTWNRINVSIRQVIDVAAGAKRAQMSNHGSPGKVPILSESVD